MTEYEETLQVAKWHKWTDILQGSSIAGLFIMIAILEMLPKHTAKTAVWYLAALEFALATVSFFVSRKALQLWSASQKNHMARMERRWNELMK